MESEKRTLQGVAIPTGQRRQAAILLSLILLLFVFLTALILPAQYNHHCTGEHCPVCALLGQCGRLLSHCRQSLCQGKLLIPGLVQSIPLFQPWVPDSLTLVDKKVRMDD